MGVLRSFDDQGVSKKKKVRKHFTIKVLSTVRRFTEGSKNNNTRASISEMDDAVPSYMNDPAAESVSRYQSGQPKQLRDETARA